MENSRLDALTRFLGDLRSRRSTLGLVAGSSLAWLGLDATDAKKRKKKKKCGKNGRKPVKGKCCTKTVNVNGKCRRCDVCARGCAFSSVQAAIDAAAPGDTIALCPGTYGGNLTIAKDLTMVGAGDGVGSGNTILQASGVARVMTTSTGTIVLQNLRFMGGYALDGTGINNSASLTLIGCTVSGNTAISAAGGGGILNDGTLDLINSTVSDNRAGAGGGILNYFNRSLRLTNSEISKNTADDGGGIFNQTGATVVLDAASRVTGNSATGALLGGGIYNNNGTVTLVSGANVSGNAPENCAGTAIALCSG